MPDYKVFEPFNCTYDKILTSEEVCEVESVKQEILRSFEEELALFCENHNLNLDQQSVLQSLECSIKSILSYCRLPSEKKDPFEISAKEYLIAKLFECEKSAADKISRDLANTIAYSSQKLANNDIALKGSVKSIAEKLTLRYLFDYRHYYDLEPIPNGSGYLYALTTNYLLDRVEEIYTQKYHKYRLWDKRSIALFSSYLFDNIGEFHDFFDMQNLRHLLEDYSEPIEITLFKEECLECWLALCADNPIHAYTELAYPNENGVIFEEYIPLHSVNEDVWSSLYEHYQQKFLDFSK
ncbi:hypothetical protein C0W44_07285 [Photobacterium leiognathi subsp. mandapamensis]|nr:hypothetical protein C0W44_07285 [Photobacterium leiognathi subsp. mandapamensis]